MLLSTEFSFVDSSVKLTETKASSPRDCNLTSSSSRSQSSVNKGALNVKFVCNIYCVRLYVSQTWCICLHNMLILLLLFIDCLVDVIETAASSLSDHSLTTPNSRSQSSVNKGVLNVKFVYNIYWSFMSSHALGLSTCVTCYCQLNFPS